jgi:hypothetical protein
MSREAGPYGFPGTIFRHSMELLFHGDFIHRFCGRGDSFSKGGGKSLQGIPRKLLGGAFACSGTRTSEGRILDSARCGTIYFFRKI